jgi:hypothetical protein
MMGSSETNSEMKQFRGKGMRRHPGRSILMDYAESLVDRQSTVSAMVGAHVTSCPRCTKEVQAIRGSLDFVASADTLNVPVDLAPQILMRVKSQDLTAPPRRSWNFAYAAVLLLMVGLAYLVFLQPSLNDTTQGQDGADAMQHAPQQMAIVGPSIDAAQQILAEVRTLSKAVWQGSETTLSPEEREHRRAVETLDADISAAMNALKRNPGSARAAEVVLANLTRQAEILRTLYVERNL